MEFNFKSKAAFATYAACITIIIEIFVMVMYDLWTFFLIANSVISAALALVYVVVYSTTTAFWETYTGWHLEISMVSIVLVLSGFATVMVFDGLDDTVWMRIYALTFIPLPFTQAWRNALLMAAYKMNKEKKTT